MSWHYLLGREEVCLGGGCSDGIPYALSKSIPTAAKSSFNGNGTASSPNSRSGMTYVHSREHRGEAQSMLLAEASPARTSVPLQEEEGKASAGNGAASGANLQGSLAKWDRDSCSWRTRRCLSREDLAGFSGTWPRWGMMQDGECWELATPVPRTGGNGSGLWPTPTANRWDGLQSHGVNVITGSLNPTWVEWLMGFPLGWTSLEPLEMRKFRQWLRSHGGFCTMEGGFRWCRGR
jgi:hypothetical protein